MKRKVILSVLVFSSTIMASDEQFESVWNKAKEKSFAIKASSEQVIASEIQLKRSEQHWLPSAYAGVQSYSTNDAGANLFGKLSQRELTASDFNPNAINSKQNQNYQKANIGVQLSLYEGGMRQNISHANQLDLESKKMNSQLMMNQFYGEIAKNYTLLASLKKQKTDLMNIDAQLEGLISKYQIGVKSNPVGYSGLLGLKSLKTKIGSLLKENQTKESVYIAAIKELSGMEIDIGKISDIDDLLSNYLNIDFKSDVQLSSLNSQSLQKQADAAAEIVKAESTRNIPRVGLFAENSMFKGDRASANAQTVGVYLNWNIFSPGDWGAKDQAVSNAHSAKYYAQAIGQKEQIEIESLHRAENTLIEVRKDLNEGQKLLDEQMIVARTLFLNGMINALQFVEVISRRVDLLSSKFEVESKLIETKTQKFVLMSHELKI